MGFLDVALTPLEWEDTRKFHDTLDYVIDHGVLQFLGVWHKVKDRKGDIMLWGDELEFHVFAKTEDGKVKLPLRAHEIIKQLVDEDEVERAKGLEPKATWHPEYGAWMIEATPSGPFGGFSQDLLTVEPSLRYRRKRIVNALKDNEGLSSMVSWPLLGVGDFCDPPGLAPGGPVSDSYFLPDSVINPHPRFATLTRNIRRRRGRKVDVRLPLFQDVNTPRPDNSADGNSATCRAAKTFSVKSADLSHDERASEVYMDAMGFGMGCCCLQVTFQTRDVRESRILYDQLATLCPIFLALSAGAPIFKGLLVDTDVRWQVIAGSVDDRTPVNFGATSTASKLPGAAVSQRGTHTISKSRYDTIDCYISDTADLRPEYNDGALEINESALDNLLKGGVDEPLARHVAHLFVRDPLVVFQERVDQVDDTTSTEHFENVQSTNWNTMRWKPPGLDVKTGWRVEFRPMEKQLTDFEDAAYITVIVLLSRVILFFDLNLYVPISKVDENMRRAHDRNAVLEQKFFFRKSLFVLKTQCASESAENGVAIDPRDAAAAATAEEPTPVDEEYEEMTIAEILTGKGEDFPGIFPLIHAYLDIMQVDNKTVEVIMQYMDFIVARANGELPTIATYIRTFVKKHPDYKHDSVISEKIGADLVKHCEQISNGEIQIPELLGANRTIPLASNVERDRTGYLAAPSLGNKRLRGASFHEEIQSDTKFLYRCGIVRSLVQKYKHMKNTPSYKHTLNAKGFLNTPAFLSSNKSAKLQ